MKKGWPTKTLGDCCVLTSGGTPSKNNPRFWVGDVPFVSARDLKSDRIETAFLHISREAVDLSATKLAPVGSLLMLVRGMGLANGIQVGEVTAPVAFNQDIRAIHPPLDFVLPRFLLLALRNSFMNGEGERVLSSAAHGTLKIDSDVLRQIAIPLPPLLEQQRIVGLIDEAFAGIATAKANAKKNLQNAGVLFEIHLQSVFTLQGKGWIVEALGEHVEFIDYRGKTPPKRESGIRLITAKNVKKGFIQRAPEEFIDAAAFDGWMTRGFPKKGDVLFTTEAPLGNVAQLDTDEKVVIGQRLITMQPDPNRLDRTFLKFMLLSKPLQKELLKKSTGATVQGIKARLLKQVPIFYPERMSEQMRIVENLQALSDETQRLESIYQQKLAALEDLKKSLLHQAFTGQL